MGAEMSEEVGFNPKTGANMHKAKKSQLKRFANRHGLKVMSTGTRGPTKQDYINAIGKYRDDRKAMKKHPKRKTANKRK